MDSQPATKSHWPQAVIVGSSLLIALLIFQIITVWVSEITTQDGMYDTTVENAAFWGGIYYALPCGLINIIVGNYARSKGLVQKKVAVIVTILGVLGILIGLLAWTFYIMISSFVF